MNQVETESSMNGHSDLLGWYCNHSIWLVRLDVNVKIVSVSHRITINFRSAAHGLVQVSDIVRLAEEMKLTCIKAFKMDALKSVLVEASKTKAALAQSLVVETIMDTQDELVNEAMRREGLSKALYQLQEPLLQSASEGLHLTFYAPRAQSDIL